MYVLELAILGYFVYGSYTGELVLLGRRSTFTAHGSLLWPACLFPLSLIGYVAVKHDPRVNMAPRTRIQVSSALVVIGLAGLVVAYFLSCTAIGNSCHS